VNGAPAARVYYFINTKNCYGTRSLPTTFNVFYSIFVNFALFLMGFAFFSQENAIFCNFKLTRSV
jgi:hypothetical protein